MKKKWRKRKRREKSERIKENAPETIKEKCGDIRRGAFPAVEP